MPWEECKNLDLAYQRQTANSVSPDHKPRGSDTRGLFEHLHLPLLQPILLRSLILHSTNN